ncbi:MAG: hypothetical protein K2L67_06910 [Clostridia bacterium]|nr:hypothetical protein [Clostridia bacterium]
MQRETTSPTSAVKIRGQQAARKKLPPRMVHGGEKVNILFIWGYFGVIIVFSQIYAGFRP